MSRHELDMFDRAVLGARNEPRAEPFVQPRDSFASTIAPADFTRVGDLLDEPEEVHNDCIDGMLPVGGTMLVAAKPKAGKTVLALNMALCVARGEPFLGRRTTRGAVLYLALEGQRKKLREQLRAMGANRSDELFLYVARAPEDAARWLGEHTERRRPVLIVIDTWQRFTRVRDTNDYAMVTRANDVLLDIARQSNAAQTWVHHAGKSDRGDGDAVLGSTALFGSVDTLLTIKRSSEGRRTFSTIQRYGIDTEETVLSMDAEKFLINVAGTRREADVGDSRIRIVEFLRMQNEWLDETTILHDVDGRKQVKQRALRDLVEDHKVLREGAGRRGAPFVYKIADPVETVSTSLPPVAYREATEAETVSGEEPCSDGIFSASRGLQATRLVPVRPEAVTSPVLDSGSDRTRWRKCEGCEAPLEAGAGRYCETCEDSAENIVLRS